MGLLKSAWRAVTRWYVIAVASIGLGILAGFLIFFNVLRARPQIGIIDIPFTVITEDSAFFIGEMLDFARRNDSIKAVVVRLNSPGGGVVESEQLFLKTLRLREEKPVVIAGDLLLASGGYMMSLGANEIYTKGSSIVGSIGVRFGVFPPGAPSETLRGTGPGKVTGDPERTILGEVEMLKEAFLQMVLTQRGDKLKITPEELAEARTYPGMQAVRLGLVDAIGTDTEAINKAATLAGISRYGFVDVNVEVLRIFVAKRDRIFASAPTEEPGPGLEGIDAVRRLFPSFGGSGTPGGVPPDFPVDVTPPRYYYLYLPPSDVVPSE